LGKLARVRVVLRKARNEGDRDLIGAIECFNQNVLACGKFDGVVDKKISHTTNAWIGQHERKCSRR